MNTCMDKWGVKFAFCQESVYKKIQETHLKNFGCKYLLQSSKIQAKISETFLKNYGARRPFLSTTFMENLKNITLRKYGCIYSLQNPDLYPKCVKSLFSNKQYIFPTTKREVTVMGYEHKTINTIITDTHPLLNRTIEEDEVLDGSDVPTFIYIDDDNKADVIIQIYS